MAAAAAAETGLIAGRAAARSAGPVPGNGPPYRVAVPGRVQVAEGGCEVAGADDEGHAELAGRLAHLPQQRREGVRDRQQCRAGDACVGRHRPPGRPRRRTAARAAARQPGRCPVPGCATVHRGGPPPALHSRLAQAGRRRAGPLRPGRRHPARHQGPGDRPSCLVVVPDSGGRRQDAPGDPDRDAFARAATPGIPARVAEPWPGHDKAAAALTHPGRYISRASDRPSGDDAITALTTAGARFASSAPEPLASETVLLAA